MRRRSPQGAVRASFFMLAPIVMLWAFVEAVRIFCGGMRDRYGRELV